MKKIQWIAIFVLAAIVVGQFLFSNNNYITKINIWGDVETPNEISDSSQFNKETVELSGEKYKGIKLKDIIDKAKAYTENSTILITGADGLTSEIDFEASDQCFIVLSPKNGWEAVNLKLPPSSNIKNITDIVVASKNEFNDFGIQFFSKDKNLINITNGMLYKKDITLKKKLEGTSIKGEDKNYVTVYTPQRLIRICDAASIPEKQQVTVLLNNGRQIITDSSQYLEIKKNTIDLFLEDEKEKLTDVRGIYISNNSASITDAYYDALHYLNQNKKVVVFLLDGFGLKQYQYAKEKNILQFLGKHKINNALSVYKPVSNAGMASIISGETPDISGVGSRKERKTIIPTIFDYLSEKQKSAVILEGDVSILDTSIKPILQVDKNNNGSVDDETYQEALSVMKKDYDLVFIHFHGIDDRGHKYGPLSDECMSHISEIDKYVEEIVQQTNRVAIITADHGLHKLENNTIGGEHGKVRYEDMLVPYIIWGE
jgi:hypothetical protein